MVKRYPHQNRFGTAADYSLFRPDGTLRAFGAATSWKDMVGDVFGKKLAKVTGKVDTDWDNNCLKWQPSGSLSVEGDRAQWNNEINHEFEVGDAITFKPHIHWFQEVNGTNDGLVVPAYNLALQWRIVRNGYGINLTTPDWTTINLDFSTAEHIKEWNLVNMGGFEYVGQISRFPDITVNCNVSDTFQFQQARTDSVTGDLLVYFQDLHGQVDSQGSDDEIAKVY